MTKPSDTQRPDIVIYLNRRQVLLRSVLLSIASLFLIVMMVVFFRPIFTGEVASSAGDIPLLIAIVVFFLVFIAGFAYLSWRIASLLSPPTKPVLMITSEGIRVGKMPPYGGFFISWDEIALIAPSSSQSGTLWQSYPRYKYLFIFPKHPDQFLVQFSSLERFGRRLDAKLVGASLYYPQVYMQSSVGTVLSQIATHYQSELNAHDVQLQR